MPSGALIPIPVALLASGTVTFTSSIFSGASLKDTASNLPLCDSATFILDVTQNASATAAQGGTAAAPVVNVYIDTSPDNGTTWFPAYAFVQVTASANQQRIDVRTDGVGLSEVGAISSLALGTGTTVSSVTSSISQNTVVTRDLRVRIKAAAQVNTFACAVWGIFSPVGRRGF